MRKKTQAFTAREKPNASEMNSKLLVFGLLFVSLVSSCITDSSGRLCFKFLSFVCPALDNGIGFRWRFHLRRASSIRPGYNKVGDLRSAERNEQEHEGTDKLAHAGD